MLTLNEGLARLAPSPGALVGFAAALIAGRGPAAALEVLGDLDRALADEYRPFGAVRADALRVAGRVAEAHDASERAVGLTEDNAVRRFLMARAASMKNDVSNSESHPEARSRALK